MNLRACVLVLCLSAVACGGSNTPSAPTPVVLPPVSIAGNWTGTFTFTPPAGGQRIIQAATATFTQAQGSITGQLNLEGNSKVLVSGIVDSISLTASVQFAAPPPSPCTGTASISGTASASQIRFSVPALASTSGCSFFTSGDFLLSR